MKAAKWQGVWTALVTPFTSDGKVDLQAFKELLRDQKAAQVAGVIPCGTTGESPCLTQDEKKLLIETTLAELDGSGVRVVAGTGTNNTAESVLLSRWAAEKGVAGLLVVTPYYNKPTQAGLENHFRTIADAVSCDLMLYNVPGRTGTSIQPETIAKLAGHPRIRALKEASGSVSLVSEIQDQLTQAGVALDILAGDDSLFLPMLSVGATGVVSVASNLFPRAMVALQNAAQAGKFDEARKLHQRFYPLFRDLFIESNPGPVKTALSWMGFCEATLRPPLAPLSATHASQLRASLERCGLRKGEPA